MLQASAGQWTLDGPAVLALGAALALLTLLFHSSAAPATQPIAVVATHPAFKKGAADAAEDLGFWLCSPPCSRSLYAAVLQADEEVDEGVLQALRSNGVRLIAVGARAPPDSNRVEGELGYSSGYMAVVAARVTLA